MKNLITGIACLLILSVFLIQISSYQVAHSKILYAETIVNSAAEKAKQEGCFTGPIISELKRKLSEKLKCGEDEITVTASSVPVYRGEIFSYEVSYPVKNIIGAGRFLGISDEENNLINVIKGTAASEYLGRP